MPEAHTPTHDDHDSAYAGLLVNDAHWAFGTDFEDPLAGVDTTVPDTVDRSVLAAYCLMLGDDSLLLSQRISEWASRAPDLEEDIALANIALDLLGQSRLLLARAAAADPSIVPDLPENSPVPPEDRLAFFRDDLQFHNVRLVEVPNGDFAETITRIVLFATWRLAVFERLAYSTDAVLAAVAAKGVKELAYHRDFAGRWFVILAQGTDQSRRRLITALNGLWPLWSELFETHAVEECLAAAGVCIDPADVAAEVDDVLNQLLAAAAVARPDVQQLAGVRNRKGRDGVHTEALSRMLAEMQVVARAHPMGRW
ncbi:phenylacetate-CoA oxygenase subunit PaaC [Mycobacterium sp. CBMA293]|uniref:1,2-phenylacetyl-CoA epoxidase subunit PaaC n=1 Tax=unclassified Mycolicibacterium TaxID=2636767 RepID=UPI0012DD9ECC|nr:MULTISPECIES: 1,2-phenylacetyl-CoA epoxidase subunit PaaC [unclassified Mycolicibacterium]MUL47167.1 phenylacetate-CoA oxygenase subunit PaaC [Mycolicibacterium sp. CBMA 360]MUL61276.1 phenylacetate-CoA oxygenase subunit PaaC [Mycolicibacterium sp. CBMA 335]MUL72011.1 phenylacetate-CoA oxygenase subunit PaaC [Mycolicibacterium sp. CBMA 311]MUL96178.1 phenylacetate-CoA oxygenase subunit PaaC [Mycolicibacterium sp. CBMA 230]MUM06708.1 phenylacetate-CoA oxygenase subunit PaaI [Mycolicibacteriu